jgi:hypothetical protein
LIVSQSSINHLHESRHHALHHAETYRKFQVIWMKMRQLLNEQGVACVADACRYGFFAAAKRYGIRQPGRGRRHTRNWRIHQNPTTWRTIALASGFSRVDIAYPPPHALAFLGPIAANAVANYFLRARFILRAHA